MTTLNVEVWKDIPGWEGLYQASSFGNIRSLLSNYKVLKQSSTGAGYKKVNLCGRGKPVTMLVHRLIAKTFTIKSSDGLVVNHVDEDKTNNQYTNLEWVTSKDNTWHSIDKLTHATVKACAKDYRVTHPNGLVENVYNMAKFCKEYGLSAGCMCQVSKGIREYHKGYKCEVLA